MPRRNEPHSELLQFWEIPEMDLVTRVTAVCDSGHTLRAARGLQRLVWGRTHSSATTTRVGTDAFVRPDF